MEPKPPSGETVSVALAQSFGHEMLSPT